jgi:hypothetical protein
MNVKLPTAASLAGSWEWNRAGVQKLAGSNLQGEECRDNLWVGRPTETGKQKLANSMFSSEFPSCQTSPVGLDLQKHRSGWRRKAVGDTSGQVGDTSGVT